MTQLLASQHTATIRICTGQPHWSLPAAYHDALGRACRHKKYLDPELQQRAVEYDGLSKDEQVR